ncbi:MAG: BspA family leucine-rich repeat surface protein, partial [Candidatus Kapabacteria bacterium]|nr:BspA family leucine-rich repeat surface protein [Candidatus Kapabacteria bacterium]
MPTSDPITISSPTTTPSIPPQSPQVQQPSTIATTTKGQCFETTQELRTSVVAYMNNDPNVHTRYGSTLNEWCVDTIQDFSSLLYNGTYTTLFESFNDDISLWNTSSATNMPYMFYAAHSFQHNLSMWDVSSVLDMLYMFYDAIVFNNDISTWDVSSVTNMDSMFSNAIQFNIDLSQWKVSSVTDMSNMFNAAVKFNSNLSLWDVSSVIEMDSMFRHTDQLNQDISLWDISSVTNMNNMFYMSSKFNQNLCPWIDHIRPGTQVYNMFTLSGCT